ncbi:hypothetical protein MMSP_0016 [Mycobacterium sp. 012931]|nr:hypothetical protein MMSP_0016 [Mycobacterium sp. 012931]
MFLFLDSNITQEWSATWTIRIYQRRAAALDFSMLAASSMSNSGR